jgi:undecaprenyl-diphosphatase
MFLNLFIINPFLRGDTAVAFLIVSFLTFVGVPLIFQILAWFYALLIGYGRIYFGVHFPLDVVVGGIIGFFTFRIVIALSLIVF